MFYLLYPRVYVFKPYAPWHHSDFTPYGFRTTLYGFKKLSLAWFNRAIKPFNRAMAAACSGDIPSTCSSQTAMINRIFDKNFILKGFLKLYLNQPFSDLPPYIGPHIRLNHSLVKGWLSYVDPFYFDADGILPKVFIPKIGKLVETLKIFLYRLTHSTQRKHFQVVIFLFPNVKGLYWHL